MAAADFTHVRVRKTTLMLLRYEISLLVRAMEMGQTEDKRNVDKINPAAQEVSIDEMILRMIEDRNRHRERRRRKVLKEETTEDKREGSQD